jgi:hypothetical protein
MIKLLDILREISPEERNIEKRLKNYLDSDVHTGGNVSLHLCLEMKMLKN